MRAAVEVIGCHPGLDPGSIPDFSQMKITFKLFATLTDYLPAQSRRSNLMELEVPGDASISQIIEPFGLPPKLVHLVLVNGTFVQPADRLSRTLKEGDVLAIWPPIAGG
jgi:sulfur carrier protein ThiS